MTTKDRIYRKELDKALAAGMREGKAIIHASEETERIYWDQVDQGRQEAKDHQQ